MIALGRDSPTRAAGERQGESGELGEPGGGLKDKKRRPGSEDPGRRASRRGGRRGKGMGGIPRRSEEDSETLSENRSFWTG